MICQSECDMHPHIHVSTFIRGLLRMNIAHIRLKLCTQNRVNAFSPWALNQHPGGAEKQAMLQCFAMMIGEGDNMSEK